MKSYKDLTVPQRRFLRAMRRSAMGPRWDEFPMVGILERWMKDENFRAFYDVYERDVRKQTEVFRMFLRRQAAVSLVHAKMKKMGLEKRLGEAEEGSGEKEAGAMDGEGKKKKRRKEPAPLIGEKEARELWKLCEESIGRGEEEAEESVEQWMAGMRHPDVSEEEARKLFEE
jgi:hypothetical protein